MFSRDGMKPKVYFFALSSSTEPLYLEFCICVKSVDHPIREVRFNIKLEIAQVKGKDETSFQWHYPVNS